ncbi:MAG: amino acid adenylation domain-containing protein [Candidatus Omnitrophota bacterium]
MKQKKLTLQETIVASTQYTRERDYWAQKLSGEMVKSIFPYDDDPHGDHDMREHKETIVNSVGFDFSEEVQASLLRISGGSNTRLHMVLTAVLAIVLGRYSGNTDMVIGTPIYDQGVGGDFINFINTELNLRLVLDHGQTFKELLLSVRQTIIDAIENQNYPVCALPLQARVTFSTDDLPLYDVMIRVENIHNKEYLSQETVGIGFIFNRIDDRLQLTLEYNPFLYREETVRQIGKNFLHTVRAVLSNLDITIRDVDILCEEEKSRILFSFNDTGTDYPRTKTIDECFEEQVERHGSRIAVIGDIYKGAHMGAPLRNSVGADPRVCPQLTYNELNERANFLANELIENGVLPDTIVGIKVERSIEMIIGIFGILKAGGAYLPIDPNFPQERIDYMLKDSGVALLVNFPLVGADPRVCPPFENKKLSGAHTGAPLPATGHRPPATSLSYIIYTSGSTGKPKGVLTMHANVTRVVKNTNYIDIRPDDRVLQLSNVAFDGSVFDIYGALLNGAALVMVNKDDLLQVDQLADWIKQEQVTVFFVTTALFNTLVDMRIDCFKRIRKVLFGGERVSVEHSRKALAFMGKGKIIHVYGPTETTVYASYYFIDAIADQAFTIPIGRPLANTTLYILDRYLNVLPVGVQGELYIGGSGTARGYLNNPDLTNDKFLNLFNLSLTKSFCPAFYKKRAAGGMLYKTGDLCRWLDDGNIEFLGRVDNQVKIRGFRIELGEIESRLRSHPGINEAVVLAITDKGADNYLCAYLVSEREIPVPELKEHLSIHLPDYMIPSYFIYLDKIPLNISGKLDKKALPEPGIGFMGEYIAPRNEMEEQLAAIWAAVLGIDQKQIGIDRDFFELGGHSLKAASVTAKIHKVLNIKVTLEDIFKYPTIQDLAEFLAQDIEEFWFYSIESYEEKEYYPVSSAQKQMYVLQQMDKDSTAYHIFSAWVILGDPDKRRIETAVKKLIQRHDSLRTSFHLIHDEPVQRIHGAVEFELNYLATEDTEFTEEDKETKTKEPKPKVFAPLFSKSGPPEAYDLSKAPLMRVGLVKQSDNKHILIVDMHHIISDGMSVNILMGDFMDFYLGVELPELRIQYKDFSEWQNEQQESIRQQGEFWLKEFAEEIPVLELPLDFTRPAVQQFEGNSIGFDVNEEITAKLNELALETGTTLYMVLLGLYVILLSKLSGQEDIIIGTPVAGRRHTDLDKIVGMFVNTLAMRNYPAGDKKFTAFLQEIKEKTFSTFENQDYPYEALVQQVVTDRAAGRNPLFDTMFELQNIDMQNLDIRGLKLSPYEYENKTSKFDLSLTGLESKGKLLFVFEYSTALFKQETIERFIGYFKNILYQVIENKDRYLSDVEIITEEEKKKIFFDFNKEISVETLRATSLYSKEKTIHQLFEEQVKRGGDRIAIVGPSFDVINVGADPRVCPQLSYNELNERSDRLAHALIEKGVGPDVIVAIQIERSIEMIIGILGILKAGGAYLPLNPNQPQDRTEFMLKDSGAALLVASPSVGADLRVCPPVENEKLSGAHTGAPLPATGHRPPATSLAYIIYTSGSTGKPKGVMIAHRNAVNVITWFVRMHRIGTDTHVPLLYDYTFDASIDPIFGSLTAGAGLFIVDKETRIDIDKLRKYIVSHRINIIDFVPTHLKELLCYGDQLKCLHTVISGGEKLNDTTKEAILAKGYRLVNQYGPTETTVDALALECSHEKVSLGKPISNVNVYILNKYEQIVPIGVIGEIHIAGAGVSTGYLNRPELTAEKFFSVSSVSPVRKQLYKTGDLGRWLSNGNIEFLDRADNQVKIRGFRIELEEIENHLLTHESIKDAVVVCHPSRDGENALCAYLVCASKFPISDLNTHLTNDLPDYMIPSYFVRLDQIPLTPNGKINRNSLPAPEITVNEQDTPPENRIEEKLIAIWSEVLGIEKEKIGTHANFFQLGGHSLKATILVSKIHKALNVDLPLTQIFRTPTIHDIAPIISQSQKNEFIDIAPAKEKKFYPLSFNQKRLWFIHQLDPKSTAFHMPGRITLNHAVQNEWIEQTLTQLSQRHESFRTGFKTIDDQPVQTIVNASSIPLENIDLSFMEENERQNECERLFRQLAATPFDLTSIPLFRATLVKLTPHVYELLFNMHHIITDGWSMEIIKNDFYTLYEELRTGQPADLEPLPIQYKDFCEWQQARLTNPDHQPPAYDFWKETLKNGIPTFRLPGDTTINRDDKTGAAYQCVIDQTMTEKLNQLAENQQTTLFTVLFSTYLILLSRFSGQNDVVCSIIGAGREHASLHHIVGFFVNSIIYHTRIDLNESFRHFLERVTRDLIERFQHQDYPLEPIFEELHMRYPDVSVSFNMLHTQESNTSSIPASITPGPGEHSQETKFDLEPYVTEYADGLHLYWSYKKNVFHPETMTYIVDDYIKLLEFFTENPSAPFIDYRKKLNTATKPVSPRSAKPLKPGHDTLPLAFNHQVTQTPDRIAVKTGDHHFTYNELSRKANIIAFSIEQLLKTTNQRIGLLFEHGVDMIAAILGTLKSGNIYVPLSASYPLKRLSSMLSDSGSSLLLTNNRNLEIASKLAEANNIRIENIDRLHTESIGLAPQEDNRSKINGESIAYILYTSGSTGKPKGVIQTHRNVLYFIENMTRVLSLSPDDKMTLLSSFGHDASIPDMYGALLNGASLYPYDVTNRDERVPDLSAFLISEQLTVWHSVPSLFRFFMNDLNTTHDFSNLRFILLGGEPLRAHDVNRCGNYFPHSKLVNIYGQTESTLSSLWVISPECCRSCEHVKIGDALDNTEILLMDDEGNPVAKLETGEIVISSPHIALGYWKNDEATKTVFDVDPLYGKIYRTGDMGRLGLDGRIAFIGRKDNQVKIRGFRVEPGEIENRLLQHDSISEAVVNVWEREGDGADTYLCAYFVCNPGQPPLSSELKSYLSDLLPDYMVPNYFVKMERMPLTPGGKIDRKALTLPEIVEINRSAYVAPRNGIEMKLQNIWRDVLKYPASISINDDFFELGGHSLKATVLAARIQKAFHVNVPLTEIFKSSTIRRLAAYIQGAKKENYEAIEPTEKKEYYTLSASQKRIYILHRMDEQGTAYNMSFVFLLEGEPDPTHLEATFQRIINRHESLRTSFHIVNDEPVQRIHDAVEPKPKVFAELFSKSDPPEAVISSFVHPFDLTQAPLFRVGLIKQGENRHILIVDMHHIVSDGTSVNIMVKDFMDMHKGETLPAFRIQYKDFSEWQNRQPQQTFIKQQENFWHNVFFGEIPELELPLDFGRPPVQRFEGSQVDFEIDEGTTRALNRLALETDTTLYIVLLALYNIFLSKLSGQEDIVVGTPVAGRRHADLETLIGMFVNTLALRNNPVGENTFLDFLDDVRENALNAFENQDYPYEELIDRLQLNRDTSRNPLIDTAFAFQNMEMQKIEIPGLVLSPYPYEIKTIKFDLELTGIEITDKLSFLLFTFKYSTALFKRETIERFIGYFKNLIIDVISHTDRKISDIEMISKEEKERILYAFNQTETEYPRTKTIPDVFEEQVEKTPDHVALIGPAYGVGVCPQLTNNELNERANFLAHELIENGVSPDTIVGIKVERSIEMIVGILGILKAGGAYLTIDPNFPQERIDYILKDSGARLLVSNFVGADPCVCPPIENSKLSGAHMGAPLPATGHRPPATSLAYVIYTSGSTGKPKGVMVSHQNVLRLIKSDYICFSPHDRLLLTGAVAFDIVTFEIWGPLFNGVPLVLASKEALLNPEPLKKILINDHITILHLIPQLFNQLAEQDIELFERLRCFMIGGDRVNPFHINQLKQKYPGLIILHLYGPTENTTFSTALLVDREYEERIPIGKPIANSTAYIMNQNGGMQPIGIAGELWVGGDGIARGYLNNPELTSEKFAGCQMPVAGCLNRTHNPNKSFCGGVRGAVFSKRAPLYKTGDLCRWLSNGNIEFLGRIDDQVKIRGIRIELREIETRLLKHENINDAVVVCRTGKDGDKSLVAYIVSHRDFPVSESKELREYLSNQLPEVMIPSYFIRMERIPLTPNGKIDRRVLPDPEISAGENYVAPRNEIEAKLVEIWSEVLGIDPSKIGIHDNFFRLGGHSLKATVLVSKIYKVFYVRVPFIEIFKTPILSAMAQYIGSAEIKTIISDDERLVSLKYGSSKHKNLFLIHDGTGDVHGYVEFCRQISDDINCWGIRAGRMEGSDPRHITMHEVAKAYIGIIKKVQADGPYQLAGWSLGGMIAFEIAVQLEQMGESIGFLSLIDSPPPHKNQDREDRVFYIPSGKVAALVHYFAASRSAIEKEQWEAYVTGEIEYHEIEGDHFSIFKQPAVIRLAEIFNDGQNGQTRRSAPTEK